MEVGGPLPLLHSLWDRLFQLATRREVVISSIVGICGLGLFWGTRRLVALNRFETQLLKQHGTHRSSSQNLMFLGESTYIQNLSSFMDIDPYRVRVFYAPHSLVSILPKPIPLIVFIHGLGGRVNQFEPLLKYFGQVADVMAVDLPGCGQSPLTDRRWDLYTTDALVKLVLRVIDEKCPNRNVILVGHSLGTLIAGRLALNLRDRCVAVVLLCAKAGISEEEKKGIQLISRLPEFVFNIFRKRDRMYGFNLQPIDGSGGIKSHSVRRMVGPNVSEDIRIQQLVWNLQSQTPTILRMLWGAKPMTREEWKDVVAPTLVIAGEEVCSANTVWLTSQDKVCPPTDGERIRTWLSASNTPDMFIVPYAGHAIMIEAPEIVCDVMNDFLVQLEPHLSHAWQLSYSATDKWSLKNEEKVRALPYKSNYQWKNVKNVSELIGTSPLRAMKAITPVIHDSL